MKRYFVYTYILSSMTEWHLDKLCSTRYWHKVHLNEILFCCNNKFIICESLCIPFCRVCTFEGQKHMFCLCLVLSICFYSLTYLVFNHYTLGVPFHMVIALSDSRIVFFPLPKQCNTYAAFDICCISILCHHD